MEQSGYQDGPERSGDTDLDQLACVKTRCAGLKKLQHNIEMGSVPIKS